jgi:hypothetical protein
MIDDDILNIEREQGNKVKTSIIVLIQELSFIGSTKDERIVAYEALDKWLIEQAKENRYYPGIKEFVTGHGDRLIKKGYMSLLALESSKSY